MQLGTRAVERGDLDTAEARFRRVLAHAPDAAGAHAGLGRVELARGRPEAARRHLERALASGRDDADLRLWLAEVERAAGRDEAARAHLEEALRHDGTHPNAHQALFELTGPAPPGSRLDAGSVLRLAEAHPYDPRVLVPAARALLRQDPSRAGLLLERALWLADLSRPAASRALELLPEVKPGWRTISMVPVHVYADEFLRTDPAWRFQLRAVWAEASRALASVLRIRFVPHTLGSFSSGAGGSPSLDDIHRGFREGLADAPERGILAAFTGQPPPARGLRRLGLAEFLRRRISVRLVPGRVESRALAHEILHLYGAIHVADDVPSLMNPAGGAFQLDRPNARIVHALRGRRFFDGPLDETVLPYVDLRETTDAFTGALSVNLHFRNIGYGRALAARAPRRLVRAEIERLRSEDPLLAQVAHMVARLMLLDDRRVEALMLLETAEALYGPDTPSGRVAAEQARRLEAHLERTLR